MKNNNSKISLVHNNKMEYPKFPYSPSKKYPEFKDSSVQENINQVYDSSRNLFFDLGLDSENFGFPNWNPFKKLIQPGETAVIKPNYVKAIHPLGDIGTRSMITHASVIRPVIDYLLLATNKDIKIVIADVPLQSSNWSLIIEKSGIAKLVDYYLEQGIEIQLLDLRKEISIQNKEGIIIRREVEERDPLGYVAVDLEKKSKLMEIIDNYDRFEITDYGSGTVPKHHNPIKNEYYVPKTMLSADLFICMPKLKTHRKAGLTGAMKNLIGINGDKSWLAHHRRGGIKAGGDEYKKFHLKTWVKWHLFAWLKRSFVGIKIATILKIIWKIIFWKGKSKEEYDLLSNNNEESKSEDFTEGSWYGNDTIWRGIHDLNHIIMYSDKNGNLCKEKQRKYLGIVDGVLAGEREGPMEHTPKQVGILVAGFNPVAIDYTSASIMGFDWEKIPQIREAIYNDTLGISGFSLKEIQDEFKKYEDINLGFIPTKGWLGHIEKK